MPPEPPPGPFPVVANWTLGLAAKVTFNEALQPGFLVIGSWTMRWAGWNYPVTLAQILFPPQDLVVLLSKGAPGIDPGPDRVTYTPPPFDVRSVATGLPNPGFVDFPIVP